MPVRGGDLCMNEACAQRARKKNAFGRNLKKDVSRQEAQRVAEEIAALSK
jgi:predicted RNA-binding protein YlxR (DUF448 family)